VLQVVDARWREHLDSMEYLRDGIHLRAMAQKDPLVEYRNEGSAMFDELNDQIREEVVRYLFHVEVAKEEPPELEPQEASEAGLVYEHESLAGSDAIAAATAGAAQAAPASGAQAATATRARSASAAAAPVSAPAAPSPFGDVGRNDPCPCGSGKKFKRCPGA
jgi:preprotein translocase subunit SecA